MLGHVDPMQELSNCASLQPWSVMGMQEGSLLACICFQKRKWNSLKRECYKKFHLALHNVVAWLESLFYFLSSPSFSLMTIESISKRICWKPRIWLMSFFVYPETMMEALIQVLLNTKYILIIYLYLFQKFQLQFEMPMVAWTEYLGKFDWQ